MWLEILSLVLNAILGGGLVVTLVTIRSVKRKAASEAKKAELDNAEHAAKIVMDSIAEPLRRELKRVSDEVAKLRKAIQKGYVCKFRDDCPVLVELQRNEGSPRDFDEGRSIRNYPRHADSGET